MSQWCREAQRTVEELKAIEMSGEELDYDLGLKCMISDYMCNRHYKEKEWKERNETYNGAVYNTSETEHLTKEQAMGWVASMHHKNSQGVSYKGEKWQMAKTTEVGKLYNVDFSKVSECEWYAVLNMVWHDYYKCSEIAKMTENVEFFIELAKCFIMDDDGYSPHEKIARYYKYIAK